MLNTAQSQARPNRKLLRLRRYWKGFRYEQCYGRLLDLARNPVIPDMVDIHMTDDFVRALIIVVPLFAIIAVLRPWDDLGP